MGSFVRLMGPVALAGVLSDCEAISGLSAYTSGECPQGCDASVDGSVSNDGHAPTDALASTDTGVGLATDAADARVDADGSSTGCPTGLIACDLGCLDPSSPSSCGGCGNACVGNAPLCVSADAGRYVCAGSDAGGVCGASGCPTSTVTKNSCAAGGCNAAGGACTASGQGCYCVRDNQCLSRKCVSVVGQNDVSCGAACTGSGAVDGFDCLLASPGIPTISPPAFGYVPSNFSPASYTAPLTATTIDCSPTYDSSAHSFTGWCAGQTPPNITSSVPQSGGPAVDVLAFSDLTINAGNTLTITSSGGGNAVILVVYGAAAIRGAIHADGNPGASGSSTSGASGAGGNVNCGAHAGQGSGDTNDDGGGGGGASGSGGPGGAGVNGAAGAAGTMRANASLKPLYGGCPGGNSGSWACTTSGGGGGGAVQISAAGPLTVSGSITANGGAGGTSACSARQSLCGTTYPGGGGGGGSGGAVLLEGQSVTTTGATITANGGSGGNPQAGAGAGGAGGTSSSATGAAGTGSAGACGAADQAAGGGGGGYGYLKMNTGAGATYACTTTLSPAPVSNAAHTACLCAADSNCSSGKCVNANSQCTGTCTGSGAADSVDCQPVTSAPTAWACSSGNCSDVTSPAGTCTASATPCWCTNDSQCGSGKCAPWAGCAAGACTASGTADAFNCVR